jgi:hypothetical protein
MNERFWRARMGSNSLRNAHGGADHQSAGPAGRKVPAGLRAPDEWSAAAGEGHLERERVTSGPIERDRSEERSNNALGERLMSASAGARRPPAPISVHGA